MRIPGRLSAVALFAGVSLLALVVSGLFDWISSSLFLLLECLAQCIRRVFGRPHQPPAARQRLVRKLPHGSRVLKPRTGRFVRRKARPARTPPGLEPSAEPLSAPRRRVLVVLRGDEPELLSFAFEECRSRNAELLLLFLRPLVIIPMGPNPMPGLSEDEDVKALFADVTSEARSLAVSVRTFYEVTSDAATAILNLAKEQEVDLVIVGSKRRGRLSRVFTSDVAKSILSRLPAHASLMVRAT